MAFGPTGSRPLGAFRMRAGAPDMRARNTPTRTGHPGRYRGRISGGALTGLTEEGKAGVHLGTQDR